MDERNFTQELEELLTPSRENDAEDELRNLGRQRPPEEPERNESLALIRETMDRLVNENKELRARLDAPAEKPEKPAEPQMIDFFPDDESFSAFFEDREAANRTLSNMFNQMREVISTNIPLMVSAEFQQRIVQQEAMNEFYAKNRELFESNIPPGEDAERVKRARSQLLLALTEEVIKNNPGRQQDLHFILDEAAKQLRAAIGFDRAGREKRRTPFAGAHGSSPRPSSIREPKSITADVLRMAQAG